MDDAATPSVSELAQLFSRLVLSVSPNFDRAFLRCQSGQNATETKACYIEASDIQIIDVIEKKEYFAPMGDLATAIFAALDKEKGLLLLSLDKTFDYNFDFEWADMTRWRIAKLNGGTGLPEGVAVEVH